MSDEIQVGECVQVFLNEEWHKGTVVRIDPYSEHRSFYWVELDQDARAILGYERISVFNPRNIQKRKMPLE